MHSHSLTSRSLLAAVCTALELLVSSAVATPVDISIAPAVSHLPPTPASGGPVTTIFGTLLPTTEPAVALADRDTPAAPPVHARNKKKRLDTIEASDGVSSPSSPLIKRSYAGSCNSCHMLDFRLLRCGCLNVSGARVTTTLNLDLCLENNNGVLRWKAEYVHCYFISPPYILPAHLSQC